MNTVARPSAARPDRSVKFVAWLKELTPAKQELLIELEKTARLISHVMSLTGDVDEKLTRRLTEVSNRMQDEYSKQPGV